MERKFKIMGLYLSILFCVVILLILVTSFSNTKLDPSYEIETEEKEYQVTFNRTMKESVNSLTESNQKLNERVKELTAEIETKNNIISEYEKINNTDAAILDEAIELYIMEDYQQSKIKLESIKVEQLNEKDVKIYNQLSLKLK